MIVSYIICSDRSNVTLYFFGLTVDFLWGFLLRDWLGFIGYLLGFFVLFLVFLHCYLCSLTFLLFFIDLLDLHGSLAGLLFYDIFLFFFCLSRCSIRNYFSSNDDRILMLPLGTEGTTSLCFFVCLLMSSYFFWNWSYCWIWVLVYEWGFVYEGPLLICPIELIHCLG